MQNDSASESRRSPSPIQEPRGLSYLNANITSFSIHTDPISQRPVVPVHNPKHNQLGTFHLEHSLAANSRLNREQQHLYNRAQQTTRVDPLGPRLTYGTAIQAGMLTRPEAGEQPEEDYEEEGDMDELEEVEESREDYVRQFTHLPPIFRAEGESTSEEEENLPSYDTKFRNLIGHYNKTMGPAVKYFRNGRPPIIPPVVAKKQARANRLCEHQILGRVSGPLFPHFSRVARAGMRTEKEQNDIERNKERAKIRQQEEADEQKQLEEQRRQKDRDEIYEMDRRTAEKFAQLAITPADRTTSSSNSIPIVRERRAMPPRDEVQGKIRAETREMQKCPKDGCIGDPYAVDNYNYENPLSTGIELDWPGAFETMHDSPISSRDISTFITRDDTEIFAKLDPLGTEQIRILDDFLSQMPEKVKPEDLSFVVDYSSFPQKMSNRPLETTGPSSGRPKDFRPIILDGCGVAYAYDPKFAPKWYGRTENLNYHPDKVLPVYPLVLATLRLTLLGHKIQIVLPHYYKVPYRKASKRLKVDNLYAFNKLVELELIKWLEPVNEDVDFMSLIEKLATTSCACIIGDDRVRYSYNSDKRNTYDELEDFSCYDIGEHIVDIDFLKSRRVQNFADQRYLSLQFFGDIKDMVIYDEYHEFIGADPTNHAARKEKYLRVTRETTMYYTDTQADIKRDDERRLENQLYVGEQVKLVLGLADLYALPHYELHACFIFLRFASRRGLQLNLLGEFIENHLPFPEPSEEDTTRIFPELTIEPSCLVNLDLNVDDALAQEAIDILEDGEYMDEEGWEGFHSAENTSSDS